MRLSADGSVLEKVYEIDLDTNGHIDIPALVTQIGPYAFWKCTGLRKIYLSEGVLIRGNAFVGCIGLTELHLPEGVQVGHYAFWGCTGIRELHLPEGVQVGESVFLCCTGLTELHIAEGVQIARNAFRNCTGLRELHLTKRAQIGAGAFFGCTGLNQIIIDGDEAEVQRITGMLPEKLQTKVVPKAQYEAAQGHIAQALKRLQFTPETNPLYFWSSASSRNGQPRLNLMDDSLICVNEFLGEESRYYTTAREGIGAFELPTTEAELVEYKAAVTSVVASYIEMARAGTPIEPDAEGEDEAATAEGLGPIAP